MGKKQNLLFTFITCTVLAVSSLRLSANQILSGFINGFLASNKALWSLIGWGRRARHLNLSIINNKNSLFNGLNSVQRRKLHVSSSRLGSNSVLGFARSVFGSFTDKIKEAANTGVISRYTAIKQPRTMMVVKGTNIEPKNSYNLKLIKQQLDLRQKAYIRIGNYDGNNEKLLDAIHNDISKLGDYGHIVSRFVNEAEWRCIKSGDSLNFIANSPTNDLDYHRFQSLINIMEAACKEGGSPYIMSLREFKFFTDVSNKNGFMIHDDFVRASVASTFHSLDQARQAMVIAERDIDGSDNDLLLGESNKPQDGTEPSYNNSDMIIMTSNSSVNFKKGDRVSINQDKDHYDLDVERLGNGTLKFELLNIYEKFRYIVSADTLNTYGLDALFYFEKEAGVIKEGSTDVEFMTLEDGYKKGFKPVLDGIKDKTSQISKVEPNFKKEIHIDARNSFAVSRSALNRFASQQGGINDFSDDDLANTAGLGSRVTSRSGVTWKKGHNDWFTATDANVKPKMVVAGVRSESAGIVTNLKVDSTAGGSFQPRPVISARGLANCLKKMSFAKKTTSIVDLPPTDTSI